MTSWHRYTSVLALVAFVHVAGPRRASADVVLDWNAIADNTAIVNGQNPFAHARVLTIVQLAVFEAVNAVTGDYEPYLGTVSVPAGASAEAAAISAAHRVLTTYFPGSATDLDTDRDASLQAIPDGSAKDAGIATGVAAADAMIAARANDGSSPAAFYVPNPVGPGIWQATATCPVDPITGVARGVFYQWGRVTPFGITAAADFMPGPPPLLDSNQYRKDYLEVSIVGSDSSPDRPQDRADVVRFYAVTSPTMIFNSAVRQIAAARGTALADNAHDLALINMSINDALIVSFAAKYQYLFWRPETAIRAGDTDGNGKTDPDPTFAPFIPTPCFPSYPSNHASGTNAGAEALRRIYGAGDHHLTLENPVVPDVVLHYTTLQQITDDVDDARVYGGIHFRFDQEAGGRLGRQVATYIHQNRLRRVNEFQ
jgi:hypothetical protein